MKKISLLLITVCISNFIYSQNLSFTWAPGTPITSNSSQRGLVAKDLNNDGNKDLIVGNAYSSDLYVYLGLGTGQFTNAPGSPINVATGPIYSAVADFNNDTKLDIITANYLSGNLLLLLGNGNGSFIPAGPPVSSGNQPYCIEAADFNQDGNMDVITTNVVSNNVIIFLGNGTGGFTTAPGFPMATGGAPYHVSTGFFNSDSYYDFAVANGNGNTVSIYFGAANAVFPSIPSATYNVGTQPRTICVKDLNSDGFPDMVITNVNSSNLSVLLGSVNGVFTNAVGSPISVINSPYQSVIVDFDMDGNQDIATTLGNNKINILLGSGNGTFNQPSAPGFPLSAGINPQPIVSEDFNGDGKPDIAFGDFGGSNTAILLNTSDIDLTNIKHLDNSISIDVVPNPFTNELNLKSELDIEKVIVFDALGRNYKVEIVDNKLSMDLELTPGIYYLAIYGDSGQLLLTKKIVKE